MDGKSAKHCVLGNRVLAFSRLMDSPAFSVRQESAQLFQCHTLRQEKPKLLPTGVPALADKLPASRVQT